MGSKAADIIDEALRGIDAADFEIVRTNTLAPHIRKRPEGVSDTDYAKISYLYGKAIIEADKFHFKREMCGEAAPYFEQAIRLDAFFPDPHMYLSECSHDAGVAMRHAEMAYIKAEATRNEGVMKLAETRKLFLQSFMALSDNDMHKAEKYLLKVLERDPAHISAHDFLAYVYDRSGYNARALYHAKEASEHGMKVGPMKPECVSRDILERMRHYDELKNTPVLSCAPETYLALSRVAEDQDDYETAVLFAEKAEAQARRFPTYVTLTEKWAKFNTEEHTTVISPESTALIAQCRERIEFLRRPQTAPVYQDVPAGAGHGFGFHTPVPSAA